MVNGVHSLEVYQHHMVPRQRALQTPTQIYSMEANCVHLFSPANKHMRLIKKCCRFVLSKQTEVLSSGSTSIANLRRPSQSLQGLKIVVLTHTQATQNPVNKYMRYRRERVSFSYQQNGCPSVTEWEVCWYLTRFVTITQMNKNWLLSVLSPWLLDIFFFSFPSFVSKTVLLSVLMECSPLFMYMSNLFHLSKSISAI